MLFLCVNTPHIDVYVKKEYLYDNEKGHVNLLKVFGLQQSLFKAEHYTLRLIFQSMVPYTTSYQ